MTETPPYREPPWREVMALAHAVDPALTMLEVVAHKPVQGEAMHKVIGFHAHKALRQVGWRDSQGWLRPLTKATPDSDWAPIYVVEEPAENAPSMKDPST